MSAGAFQPAAPVRVNLAYMRIYMALTRAIDEVRLSSVARSMLDYLLQRTQGADSERQATMGVRYGIRPLARILKRYPGEIQRGDKQLREAGIIITTERKSRAWVMHPSLWTERVNHDARHLPSIETPHGLVLYAPRSSQRPMNRAKRLIPKRTYFPGLVAPESTQAVYAYTTPAERTSKEAKSMQVIHRADLLYFWLNNKKTSYIEFARDMMDKLFPTWKNWEYSITKCEIVALLRQRISEHTAGAWTATLTECRLVLARLEATQEMLGEEMAAAARLEEAAAQQASRDEARRAADLLRDMANEGYLSRAGAAALAAYDADPSRIAETIDAAHDERNGSALRRERADHMAERERADRMAELRAVATPEVAPEVVVVPPVEVIPEVAVVPSVEAPVVAAEVPVVAALVVAAPVAAPVAVVAAPAVAAPISAVAAPVVGVIPAPAAVVPAVGTAPAVAAIPPDPRPAHALDAFAEVRPPEIGLKTQTYPSKEPDRPSIHARWLAYGCRPAGSVSTRPPPPPERRRTLDQNRKYANLIQDYLKEGMSIQEAISRARAVSDADEPPPSHRKDESSLGGPAS